MKVYILYKRQLCGNKSNDILFGIFEFEKEVLEWLIKDISLYATIGYIGEIIYKEK